jgi:DNA-binding response OmpR family regulator
MPSLSNILLVDDEDAIRLSLRKALSQEDVSIHEARSGGEALQLLSQTSFDLVLTDIRMEDLSGLDLLAAIRDRFPDTVVILLTGYASVESAVQALRKGAYDYLIKPVSIEAVRASIREGLAKRVEKRRRREVLALLRDSILELSEQGTPDLRSEQQTDPQWLQVGDLVVDTAKLTVTVAGAQIPLTPTEYQVLTSLLDSRGRVLGYQELVRQVYGYECDFTEARKLIMPHVSNLRRKLFKEPNSPNLIENVRGAGYTFLQPDE